MTEPTKHSGPLTGVRVVDLTPMRRRSWPTWART